MVRGSMTLDRFDAIYVRESRRRITELQRFNFGSVGFVPLLQAGSATVHFPDESPAELKQSVNEGRGDELVWVSTNNVEVEHWYSLLTKRHPDWEQRGTFDPWQLVDRYVEKGFVKGYILYHHDDSARRTSEYARVMNESVNVATSLAGILDGVLIDERLQAQAEAHGLKLLVDARTMGAADCFKKYQDRFHRRMLCAQDPKKSNVRDLAISQGVFTLYGNGPLTTEVMQWLTPLSPILGWNGGDEFETTKLSTIHGHFQTASDWCMNLPVLMAASDTAPAAKVPHVDPRTIDWKDSRSAVSFVMSDGDNVQWSESSFFLSNNSYWNSPDRGKIPFGWSCCFSHLTQLAPVIIEHALETRKPNDEMIEWGGGYYYPDLFGAARTDRWALMAQHAAKTWQLMRQNDTRIIGFNVWKPNSPEALKSYQVFAEQTDGLLAIFAFQYAPYEGGARKTYWVKDRAGNEVPVITARYSIWEHSNERPSSGTPAKVAREIQDTVNNQGNQPRYDWVVVHAWSYFQKHDGTDENAENLEQRKAALKGGVRGYTPVTWCAERLPKNIMVIGPEEIAWRLRMQHNPNETKKLLDKMKESK
jgi:hypothetical protein